jgi:hypothetical protein
MNIDEKDTVNTAILKLSAALAVVSDGHINDRAYDGALYVMNNVIDELADFTGLSLQVGKNVLTINCKGA